MLFCAESLGSKQLAKGLDSISYFLWSKDDVFYLDGLAYFESRRQIQATEVYMRRIQETL
jgi:hypothetical protein